MLYPFLIYDKVQDDASISWRKRKKHFFILSHSGKPIYSRFVCCEIQHHLVHKFSYFMMQNREQWYTICFSVSYILCISHGILGMEMNINLQDFQQHCKQLSLSWRMGMWPHPVL